MSVFIIAEAGVNHNGSLEVAKRLVDKAKEAGADSIKFQTYISENIVSRTAPKAEYQMRMDDLNKTQLSMLKRLELSFEDFSKLVEYCRARNILFLSSPFDFESIAFLQSLKMAKWKIPSGEITNLPYLIKIAKTKQPIILSTGMSTIEEIHAAIEVLNQYQSGDITLLHCTTEYPAPYEEVNLKAILTMRETFQLPIGYSDHTRGVEIPIAAVALGATVIEKHFTLDRNMEGPDHQASMEPDEFARMVSSIRIIEKAMGTGFKAPTKSEKKNLAIARKSIVARCRIKQGEVLTEDKLAVKRPGTGISPMEWFNIIGKRASKDFEEDELIKF